MNLEAKWILDFHKALKGLINNCHCHVNSRVKAKKKTPSQETNALRKVLNNYHLILLFWHLVSIKEKSSKDFIKRSTQCVECNPQIRHITKEPSDIKNPLYEQRIDLLYFRKKCIWKRIRPPNKLILNKHEVLIGASLPLFHEGVWDSLRWSYQHQNRRMSFRLLFRSLRFLALVFSTISLVCFGVQEKKVGKNSCFGVSWFSNAPSVWPWQDSNDSPVKSYLPSLFWQKREINEVTLIFKMTEDAFSFLGRESKTQIKPPRNWTVQNEKNYFSGGPLIFYEVKGCWWALGGRGPCEKNGFRGGPSQKN